MIRPLILPALVKPARANRLRRLSVPFDGPGLWMLRRIVLSTIAGQSHGELDSGYSTAELLSINSVLPSEPFNPEVAHPARLVMTKIEWKLVFEFLTHQIQQQRQTLTPLFPEYSFEYMFFCLMALRSGMSDITYITADR